MIPAMNVHCTISYREYALPQEALSGGAGYEK